MMRLVGLLALPVLWLLTFSGTAGAEPSLLAADEAFALSQQNDLIIVDVRTPEEWRQSGVAQGAVPLSLQDPEFGPKLRALFDQNRQTPVAMICATGGRSTAVVNQLASYGITDVRNISEGMFGSSAGPGWLKRGLPVEQPGTRGQ